MKRFYLLVGLLLLLIIPLQALAAGTVTVSRFSLGGDKRTLVIKLACVGDSSDGSVPDTVINQDSINSGLSYKYQNSSFYLWEVWTIPGSPSPDAADITIKDATTAVLFDEDNVLHATDPTEGTVVRAKSVNSVLTVIHENQGTASAQWDTYIKLVR